MSRLYHGRHRSRLYKRICLVDLSRDFGWVSLVVSYDCRWANDVLDSTGFVYARQFVEQLQYDGKWIRSVVIIWLPMGRRFLNRHRCCIYMKIRLVVAIQQQCSAKVAVWSNETPPLRGGFLFTMFPHQNPWVRGSPSKNLYKVLRDGSSYSRFLMKEHSK